MLEKCQVSCPRTSRGKPYNSWRSKHVPWALGRAPDPKGKRRSSTAAHNWWRLSKYLLRQWVCVQPGELCQHCGSSLRPLPTSWTCPWEEPQKRITLQCMLTLSTNGTLRFLHFFHVSSHTHAGVLSEVSTNIYTFSLYITGCSGKSDQVEHTVFVNMTPNFKVKGKIHAPSHHISIN